MEKLREILEKAKKRPEVPVKARLRAPKAREIVESEVPVKRSEKERRTEQAACCGLRVFLYTADALEQFKEVIREYETTRRPMPDELRRALEYAGYLLSRIDVECGIDTRSLREWIKERHDLIYSGMLRKEEEKTLSEMKALHMQMTSEISGLLRRACAKD